MAERTHGNDHEAAAELRAYLVGFALALLLTIVPFAAVAFDLAARTTALAVAGVLGLVQIVVHFRFFLHIDLGRQKREDLQLILFSTLLLAIMAGGTIWIMLNLYGRMMPAMGAG